MLHCMSFAQVLAQANIIHKFYQMLHSHNNELLSALIWKHVQSHHWRYRFQSACDTKAIQQTSKKKLECKSNYKTKILAVVNLDILQSQQYIFFIISLHRVGFRSFSFHFFFHLCASGQFSLRSIFMVVWTTFTSHLALCHPAYSSLNVRGWWGATSCPNTFISKTRRVHSKKASLY